jgi:signal transduction histidine kinase
VEGTAYFVVAEAIANALKHAGADELAVRLALVDGCLHIEVRDDGSGGASPLAGTGLRGLADRVDTLGGRFRIHSPAGAGTRIIAELPCE